MCDTMDPRMFTNEEYRKAMERCLDCEDRFECEPFLTMKEGGQVIRHCPKGKPSVI